MLRRPSRFALPLAALGALGLLAACEESEIVADKPEGGASMEELRETAEDSEIMEEPEPGVDEEVDAPPAILD